MATTQAAPGKKGLINFDFLQKLGKVLMTVIAVMPAAGLMISLGKLVWECPKCGNRDQNKLNVARRTCGYIGTQFWNQGRTQEIKDRVLHL